jgi:hypothetical protein
MQELARPGCVRANQSALHVPRELSLEDLSEKWSESDPAPKEVIEAT